MVTCNLVVSVCAAVLIFTVSAQTPRDAPARSVRVSGRVVPPNGGSVVIEVHFARVVSDGLMDARKVTPGSDGLFSFLAAPNQHYRFAVLPGRLTQERMIDTGSGQDVDLGILVLKWGQPLDASSLPGDLTPEQIVIEPQPAGSGFPTLSLPRTGLEPKTPEEALRSEVHLDHPVTVEAFVGGKVKLIRVVRYDPELTPSQVKNEVRGAWLGAFSGASGMILWDEGNRWNIQASVEYEDGKRTSILIDGWCHVQVEDREGKYWFLRLWPAA